MAFTWTMAIAMTAVDYGAIMTAATVWCRGLISLPIAASE